jgi:hypothetical protein
MYDESPIRKAQYVEGINTLKAYAGGSRIIIVENNGPRATFLDRLGCQVLYTSNNKLPTSNKGTKELQDVLDCIRQFQIKDTDFIVKMTGRYVLTDPAEFMQAVQSDRYDCVIKYGPYFAPVDYKLDNCITGLIGMRCGYVKQIERPDGDECVEIKWGKVTRLIPDTSIYKVQKLGIRICPGCNTYFSV